MLPANEVGGGGWVLYWNHLVRLSVRPFVCRRNFLILMNRFSFKLYVNLICNEVEQDPDRTLSSRILQLDLITMMRERCLLFSKVIGQRSIGCSITH